MKRYRARRYFVLRPNGIDGRESLVESSWPTRRQAEDEAERRTCEEAAAGTRAFSSRDVVLDRRPR